MQWHGSVLTPGEAVWAARMTLGPNLSDSVTCVMQVAAVMAPLLLTGNGGHSSSHEHHFLSKDFIPGPVLSTILHERREVETQRGLVTSPRPHSW